VDKIKGLRPKNGGIEIRADYNKVQYSWFLNKPWNRTNCAEASRVRRQKIEELKQTSSSDHLRRENPLFQTVAQDYLNAIKVRCTQSYINLARRDINNIWLPELGLIPIKNIRVRDVRLADQAFTWSSAKRQQNARSVLRGIFDTAIMDELIDTNPAQKLLKVSHQNPDIDPFTSEEKEILLDLFSGQVRLYFLLAFETGMRTAELMGLRAEDFRGKRLHLERTMVLRQYKPMKIKQTRTIIMSQRLQDALREAPRHISGHMWINSLGQLLKDPKVFNKAWRVALSTTGIRYRRAYNCRHTRASLGLSAGQTPAWLAKQLGHDLRTFFARYADYIDSNSDDAEMAKLVPSKNTKLGKNWDISQ